MSTSASAGGFQFRSCRYDRGGTGVENRCTRRQGPNLFDSVARRAATHATPGVILSLPKLPKNSRCRMCRALLATTYRRLRWPFPIDGRSAVQAALPVCRRESAGHTLRLTSSNTRKPVCGVGFQPAALWGRFSTCPSVTFQPISDPVYALMRIISNACNVAAIRLTSLLPIAGQSLASSFSCDFQMP